MAKEEGDALKEYIGKKYKLEKSEQFQMVTRYTKARKWFMKIYTETIKKVNENEVRASILFPLIRKNTWEPYAKLDSVLSEYGVKKPEELFGKEVIITRNARGWLEWRPVNMTKTSKKYFQKELDKYEMLKGKEEKASKE